MSTFVFILLGLSGVAQVWLFLVWVGIEMFGRPSRFTCQCRMFPTFRFHMDTPWLLATSILCGVVAVVDLAMLTFGVAHSNFARVWTLLWAIVYSIESLLYYRRWKKHDKGGKHGSLAKLLAKVKITPAGLRVVPVKGD